MAKVNLSFQYVYRMEVNLGCRYTYVAEVTLGLYISIAGVEIYDS